MGSPKISERERCGRSSACAVCIYKNVCMYVYRPPVPPLDLTQENRGNILFNNVFFKVGDKLEGGREWHTETRDLVIEVEENGGWEGGGEGSL